MSQKAIDSLTNKKPSWRKSLKKEDFDVTLTQKFIESLKINVVHGGNKSYYVRPSPAEAFPNHFAGDYIKIPLLIQFNSINEYYFTLFHEVSHWAEIRVNLDLKSIEAELVAEIVSNKLCNQFKIKQEVYLNYNFYLNDWIEELKVNKLFVKQCLKKSNLILNYLKAENENAKIY